MKLGFRSKNQQSRSDVKIGVTVMWFTNILRQNLNIETQKQVWQHIYSMEDNLVPPPPKKKCSEVGIKSKFKRDIITI